MMLESSRYDKWDRGGGGSGGSSSAWGGRERERERERERQARAHQMSHAPEPDESSLFPAPVRVTGHKDRVSQQIQIKLGDYRLAQTFLDDPSKSIGICAEPPSPAPCPPSRRENEFKKPSHAPASQNGRVHHRSHVYNKSEISGSTAPHHRPPPLRIPNGYQHQNAIDSSQPAIESILKEMKSLPTPLSSIAPTPRKELDNKFIFNPYTNKVQENLQHNEDLKPPSKSGLDNRISNHSSSISPEHVVNKDPILSESDDETAASRTRLGLDPLISPIRTASCPSSGSESSLSDSESSSSSSSSVATPTVPATSQPAPAPPPQQQRSSWSLSNFAPPQSAPLEQNAAHYDSGKEIENALADVKGKPNLISDLSDSDVSSPESVARRRSAQSKRASSPPSPPSSDDDDVQHLQSAGGKRARIGGRSATGAKRGRGRPRKTRSPPPAPAHKGFIFRKVFTPKKGDECGGKGGKGGKGKGGKGQVTIIEVTPETVQDDDRRLRHDSLSQRLSPIEDTARRRDERPNERIAERMVVDRINAEKMDRLNAEKMDRLTAEKMDRLTAEKMDRLTAEKMDRLTAEKMDRLTAEKLDRLTAEKMDRLTAEKMDRLTAEKMDRFSAEKDRLAAEKFNRLSAEKLDRLPTDKLDRLSGDKMERLPVDKMDRLSADKLDRLSAEKSDRLERPERRSSDRRRSVERRSADRVPDRYIKAEADVGSALKHERGSERLSESDGSEPLALSGCAPGSLPVRVQLSRLSAHTVRNLHDLKRRVNLVTKPDIHTPNIELVDRAACSDSSARRTESSSPVYYSYFERLPPDVLSDEERDHKHYLHEAKRLREAALKEGEPLSRVMLYLESVLCFVLTGRVLELELETKKAFTIYRETIEYIKSIHSMPQRYRASPHSPHSTFSKLDILSLRVQALLYLRMFKMYNREVKEYYKIVQDYQQKPASAEASIPTLSPLSASPAGSCSGSGSSGYCSLAHAVPAPTHHALLQLTKYYTFLYVAHELWEQADVLCRMKNNQDLFIAVDRKCGPLTLFSTFRHLVQYVRHAIALLKHRSPTHDTPNAQTPNSHHTPNAHHTPSTD